MDCCSTESQLCVGCPGLQVCIDICHFMRRFELGCMTDFHHKCTLSSSHPEHQDPVCRCVFQHWEEGTGPLQANNPEYPTHDPTYLGPIYNFGWWACRGEKPRSSRVRLQQHRGHLGLQEKEPYHASNQHLQQSHSDQQTTGIFPDLHVKRPYCWSNSPSQSTSFTWR